MAIKNLVDSYFIKDRFIVIEGIDGSGKSTLALDMPHILRQVSMDRHLTVHLLNQPGGTQIGDRIRDILKDPNIEEIHPRVRHLLLSANRMDILLWIQKTKERNPKSWFISDRHVDSTYVYQGEEGLWENHIDLVQCLYSGLPYPDLTIFLDVSPGVALSRLAKRDSIKDKYDHANLDTIKSRIDKYHELITNRPHKYFVVNADGTPEQIMEYIINNLKLEF